MNLVLAQEELWYPSREKLKNAAQVNYQVEEVLDSAHYLSMIADRDSLDLLEDEEELACHIVQRVEHFVHEVCRPLVIKLQ